MMDELDDFLKQNQPFVLSLLNRPRFTGLVRLSDNHLRQLIKECVQKIVLLPGSVISMKRLIDALKKMARCQRSLPKQRPCSTELSYICNVEATRTASIFLFPFTVILQPEGHIGIQDNPMTKVFIAT